MQVSCDVTNPKQYHKGATAKYTARDYECLHGNQSHYFCKHHHEQKSCPAHPTHQRRQ